MHEQSCISRTIVQVSTRMLTNMHEGQTAARRAVSILFLVNGVAFANWGARIPAVRERLGLTDGQLGVALLGIAVGALLAFRAAGLLIVRHSSRRVTELSAYLLCATLPLPALAPSYVSLIVALLLLGAANGLMDVAMNAQAVEVEKVVGRPILSAFHGMFSLGGLIGALMGAFAAGLEVSAPAHLTAVAALLVVPVVAAGRPLLPDAHVAPARRTDRSLHGRSLFVIGLGLVAFCSSVGEGAMIDWSAVYLRSELHTSAALAAIGYAAFSVMMLCGRFTGDRLTERFGPVRVVRRNRRSDINSCRTAIRGRKRRGRPVHARPGPGRES